ncbi:hypothetical protein V499_09329 [Pseudogymnoascus sp. VKM F-103]|nr:hypothetical protein V499_09329 [Pseudogymnoascus sp. VKM F-103]
MLCACIQYARTGTVADFLSSSASPLFVASLPTPLVDLETDGRPGPIQNSSVSSPQSFPFPFPLFFPPPASPRQPLNRRRRIPLRRSPPNLPSGNFNIDDDNHRPTRPTDSEDHQIRQKTTHRTDRQNDPVHQPPRPIPTIYDPETRPRPSPQLSSSTTYPQASINV